VSSVVGLNFK